MNNPHACWCLIDLDSKIPVMPLHLLGEGCNDMFGQVTWAASVNLTEVFEIVYSQFPSHKESKAIKRASTEMSDKPLFYFEAGFMDEELPRYTPTQM